jgi:hypothetical protein
VSDTVETDARREVVGDRRHAAAPQGEGSDDDERPEPGGAEPDEHELRRVHVTVRLTVEAVARHVPASVRVAVLDLMSDLERLDAEVTGMTEGTKAAAATKATTVTEVAEGGADGRTR